MAIRSVEYLQSLVRELAKLPDETEWVEFKCNNKQPHMIGEYISALSNSAALCERPKAYLVWGVDDATNYLASDKKPSDYKEMVPASGGKDMKALITISPKWNDTAGKEGQLEQIITQKWLACWPESYEAWSEQRRTGYPKLFKVQTNNSGGTIDTNDMIRRLPFSTDDADKDPVQYDLLKKALGGPDHGGTRLWWDAGKNNF